MNQRLITWACAALALLALAGQATADSHVAFAPGRLIVEAEGELLVPYDMIEVTLEMAVDDEGGWEPNFESRTFDSVGADASLAQERHDNVTKELLSILSADLGVPLANMTTESYTIEEQCDGYCYSDSEVTGYEAYSRIRLDVAVSKIDVLPKIYEAAASMTSTANSDRDHQVTVSVDNFWPYLSDELLSSKDAELFALTMAEANSKAEMYAAASGRVLGPILGLSDSRIQVTSSSETATSYDDYYSEGNGGASDIPDVTSFSGVAETAPVLSEVPAETQTLALDANAPNYSVSDIAGQSFFLGNGETLWKTLYVEYELGN